MHFSDYGSGKLGYAFCTHCNSKVSMNVALMKKSTINVHFMAYKIVHIDNATFKNWRCLRVH